MRKVFACLLLIYSSVLFSQNQNISNGFVFDGEPYIAINPNNSQHLVVAWMGYKFNNIIVINTRVSFDAGATWSTKNSIPHTVSGYQSADPSMAFDNNGNLFLCFIDYTPNPASGAVYVSKSTDGGLNWGVPVEVINVNSDPGKQPVDRPWMVIDNSGGIHDGNIYITTMNPNVFGPVSPPYNPYFIKSTNGGASFQPWRYLDTTNWLAGNAIPQPMPTPTVSSNGAFHAIYPSYVNSQNFLPQFIIASSNSAGNSFTYNSVFQSANTNNDTLPKKGYLLISNPADNNHLAFIHPNFDNGDIDVYLTESMDAGATWSSPYRVNDDPIANNRMQDLIWADFDNDGDLIIAWRDRRNSNDSTYKTRSEIYAAYRKKDSTNFSANFPLSDSSISYNSILENNGNDFMCIKLINDTAYAVWGDTRNNYLNIWFQQIDLVNGNVSTKDLANDIKPISFYPNPTESTLNFNLGLNDLNEAFIYILNANGSIILETSIKTSKNSINLSHLSAGIYFIKFSNKEGAWTKKFIKQ